MAFVDQIEIRVRSGHGGPGMVNFKAAKNQPKLGPDGGDGGFGGHVFFVGDAQLNSLSGLYYKRLYAAEDGHKGGTNGKTGRNGEDCLIPVPIGTQAFDPESGILLAEVLEDGQRICIAEGGKRGLGNMRFLSSTHQAPEEHTPGGEGQELDLRLELKLIADVGFAGFPNAGKSTLLSSISAARPKIADYPFTTLTPQLGVVTVPEMDPWGSASFVAADIPGLIEGAALGRGLGHEFLKHLERTKLIVYVIDPFNLEEMPSVDAWTTLRHELSSFSEDLANKKSIVVLTKSDIAPEDCDWEEIEAPLRKLGLSTLRLSAVSHDGVAEFKRKVWQLVQEERQRIQVEVPKILPVIERDAGYKWVSQAHVDSEFGI